MRTEDLAESMLWVGREILEEVRREVNWASEVVAEARLPSTR